MMIMIYPHRRAILFATLFLGIAGCSQPPARDPASPSPPAGKGDTAWSSDAKNLEGLPGKYARSDGAPGELGALEIASTTVPHAMLAPLGALSAACTAKRVCAVGAPCPSIPGQCAAVMRHPTVDASVLVVQTSSSTEAYLIEALDRDDADTVVRMRLRRVDDPETLADPQPAILLEREGHTPPQLVADIDSMQGIGGSYVAPPAPGVRLARLELAPPSDADSACGIFHHWVFPPGCEGNSCAILERGTYRAEPRSTVPTSPSLAKLKLEQGSGATQSFVIQGQLHSSSGNITRLVLREELGAGLGPELTLERSYPQVPARSAAKNMAGIEGFYQREGAAPALSLLEMDLGPLTTGTGRYSLSLTKDCSIERIVEQGTYQPIPENPMVGFASITFTDRWGYAESYVIDAVQQDSVGAVAGMILRYVAKDLTDPSAEPWIVMRRLP